MMSLQHDPASPAGGDSQDNFRTFCETVDDLILVADTAGHVLYGNSAVTAKLGYEAGDLQGMHLLDFHRLEDQAAAAAIVAEMLAGLRRYCPLPLQAKDGHVLPAETRVWRGTWNGQAALFGVVKDLSEQQAALQMFQAVFENNPTPMALSRLPQRILVNVNQAYTQITEFRKDEVLGKTSLELGLFADVRQALAVAAQLEATGRFHSTPVTIRTKSGALREGLFFGEVVRSQGEGYFLTAMVDVTAQVLSERRLREAHETLEGRVRERTAELQAANALLQEENASRRQAEAALAEHRERLRGLASQLSLAEEQQRHKLAIELHDTVGQELAMARLRLQHVQAGMAAGGGPRAGDHGRHLEIAIQLLEAAVGHVRDLTDDLGGSVLYELGLPAALRSLGQHVARQHALRFQYRQAGRYQRLDRNLEVQVLRAARELVFNVVKHAQATLLEIALDVADDALVVQVEDNGRGFVPPWPSSGSTAAAAGGGFGLFSIREQLAVFQGRLELRSQLGAGTLATITVPAIPTVDSAPTRD